MRRLALGILTAFCAFAGVGRTSPQGPPRAMASTTLPPVGLCVRTAKDGLVGLEARVMRSSGDLQTDANAIRTVIGTRLPSPMARKWSEWLPMQIGYANRPGGYVEQRINFDCAALERRTQRAGT